MYISIRYINSERIPRFSHESRFEFLNEIDRRTEREGLNSCPHSLLSYPLFRVETTRMQRQWWEDYRNRINRCFLRNRRVAIIGCNPFPRFDQTKSSWWFKLFTSLRPIFSLLSLPCSCVVDPFRFRGDSSF